MQKRIFPPKSPAPVFVECGCCGSWHDRNLPNSIDCRDDRHRFTSDDLNLHYGATNWEEITLEEQIEAEGEDLC